MSTYMQSAFKTLFTLPLSDKPDMNIYLFTNHGNKEPAPRLYSHHVTLGLRGHRAPAKVRKIVI